MFMCEVAGIFDPACYYGHHEAEWGMSWCMRCVLQEENVLQWTGVERPNDGMASNMFEDMCGLGRALSHGLLCEREFGFLYLPAMSTRESKSDVVDLSSAVVCASRFRRQFRRSEIEVNERGSGCLGVCGQREELVALCEPSSPLRRSDI